MLWRHWRASPSPYRNSHAAGGGTDDERLSSAATQDYRCVLRFLVSKTHIYMYITIIIAFYFIFKEYFLIATSMEQEENPQDGVCNRRFLL